MRSWARARASCTHGILDLGAALGGAHTDPGDRARREHVFIVAVQLAGRQHLLLRVHGHRPPPRRLYCRTRTPPWRSATRRARRTRAPPGTRARRDRHQGPALLRNMENPRWEEVAERCLSCGNCTMVCPTCFCTSVEDVTDLDNEHVERHQRCTCAPPVDYSDPRGAVRASTRSRYRQWMTHKLATWIDQFSAAPAASAAGAASRGARSGSGSPRGGAIRRTDKGPATPAIAATGEALDADA